MFSGVFVMKITSLFILSFILLCPSLLFSYEYYGSSFLFSEETDTSFLIEDKVLTKNVMTVENLILNSEELDVFIPYGDRWLIQRGNFKWATEIIREAYQYYYMDEYEVRMNAVLEDKDEYTSTYTYADKKFIFFYNDNKAIVKSNEDRIFYQNSMDLIRIYSADGCQIHLSSNPEELNKIITPKGTIYQFMVLNSIQDLQYLNNKPNVEPSPLSLQVADYALSYIGNTHVPSVKGQLFNHDCSGFVSAMYYQYDINLIQDIDKVEQRSGYNLTSTIYDAQRYQNRILNIEENKPLPGDIIFFNYTYDRNFNGLNDDKLTHIGIVVEVSEDNTIYFIHHINPTLGIRIDKLNLDHPADPNLNAKIVSQGNGPKLAGELVEGFARVFPEKVNNERIKREEEKPSTYGILDILPRY